jgi:NarL family two-component system response regulator LiaR
LVLEDNAMPQSRLVSSLSDLDELDVVARANSGREALDLCQHVQPQIILVDSHCRTAESNPCLRSLRQRWPHIQLVVLAEGLDTQDLQQTHRAARDACLFVGSSPTRLSQLISRASANAQPRLASGDDQHRLRACPNKALSHKEQTVLHLMARGLSDQEIANVLEVNELTARFHTGNVLTKLGAATRAAALNLAFERHLIEPVACEE